MNAGIPLAISLGIFIAGLFLARHKYRQLSTIVFGASFGLFILTIGTTMVIIATSGH